MVFKIYNFKLYVCYMYFQMLKRLHYYSIRVDGSTDARSKEKEVIYILYVDPDNR